MPTFPYSPNPQLPTLNYPHTTILHLPGHALRAALRAGLRPFPERVIFLLLHNKFSLNSKASRTHQVFSAFFSDSHFSFSVRPDIFSPDLKIIFYNLPQTSSKYLLPFPTFPRSDHTSRSLFLSVLHSLSEDAFVPR